MPMYNLLEYSKNYRKTIGSLWGYYRDEPKNLLSSNSECFKFKTSIQEIFMMVMVVMMQTEPVRIKLLYH